MVDPWRTFLEVGWGLGLFQLILLITAWVALAGLALAIIHILLRNYQQ